VQNLAAPRKGFSALWEGKPSCGVQKEKKREAMLWEGGNTSSLSLPLMRRAGDKRLIEALFQGGGGRLRGGLETSEKLFVSLGEDVCIGLMLISVKKDSRPGWKGHQLYKRLKNGKKNHCAGKTN